MADAFVHIFNAPCANVNSTGLICWGSNPHPDVATGCFRAMWKLFWDAPFNDNWSDNKSVRYPKKINPLLLEPGQAKATRYPEEDLQPLKNQFVPQGATIDQMIAVMTKGAENDWL